MTESIEGRPRLGGVRLLKATEVADLLRVSRSCVYKLTRMRLLPCVRVTEGAVRSQRRWTESAVLEYLARQSAG